jgi:putative transposase
MPNYRRYHVPGATYYFHAALLDHSSRLLSDRIGVFRTAWRRTQDELPFTCDTLVILPNGIHTIWTLPTGDSDYSARWQRMKWLFSNALPGHGRPNASMVRKRERGIWQRRFWEHMVRDDQDLWFHRQLCLAQIDAGGIQVGPDWSLQSGFARAA